MAQRQVVAVLVRELRSARDARHGRHDAGGGEGGKRAQGTAAVQASQRGHVFCLQDLRNALDAI
ncbi:hypothetical protein D3C86_1950590 [compost metagenome]